MKMSSLRVFFFNATIKHSRKFLGLTSLKCLWYWSNTIFLVSTTRTKLNIYDAMSQKMWQRCQLLRKLQFPNFWMEINWISDRPQTNSIYKPAIHISCVCHVTALNIFSSNLSIGHKKKKRVQNFSFIKRNFF